MDQVGSVEIVIKGGRPWGFTLQGGIESRAALTVAQIEPRGKADRHGALKVGDHVLRINDVQCFSLADATQLIDCAFKTLTVLVWRSKSAVEVPCPQIRDHRKYSLSRFHRNSNPKDDSLVKRTSAASSHKVLPRFAPQDHISAQAQEASPSQVTLTCDSHQEAMKNQEINGLKKLWSSGDRSPLPSNASFFLSSKSDSTLSLASTIDSQEDIFQTYESYSRYTRSPRNLTKDSGYETCAQTEHDYVNVEWINGTQVPNRTPLSSPLPPAPSGDYSKPPKGSSTNKMPKPPVEYSQNYSSMDGCQEWKLERYEKSLVEQCHRSSENNSGQAYCSDCNESGIPSAPVPSKKRTGSFSSLCSSTESLSSRSSKKDASNIRSSKSSLSLRSDTEKHKPVPSQLNVVNNSCQYFNKVVSSAQSTPDLHAKREMFPRRANKKSVYEELACKSGFDFSPMVQRQPFRLQTKVFEKDDARETTHVVSVPGSRNIDQEPLSLPAHCDKISPSETIQNYYAPAKMQYGSPSDSSPPPIPARESSLHYRGNATHEKFPSWPASLPLEDDLASTSPASGCRSNSWTEQTQCPKEPTRSYSRPETHFQISAEQLPPVQEKKKKSSRNSSVTTKTEHLTNHAAVKYSHTKSLSGNETFNSLTNHYAIDHVYQSSEDVFYPSDKKCSTHSPPERDVLPNFGNASIKQRKNYPYKEVYENIPRHIPETFGIYENLRTAVGDSVSHTNTPLLDRLRLESENLPSSWSRQEVDAFSDTGTCIGSDSSSQETLKWHGSCSDLVSVDNFSRNDSPSYGSDTSTIYEELRPGSFDGSEHSYSTICSSPSDYRTEKCPKENKWGKFSVAPYLPSSVNQELTNKHPINQTQMLVESGEANPKIRRNNTQYDMSEDRKSTTNCSLSLPPSYYNQTSSNMPRENEKDSALYYSKPRITHSISDSEANRDSSHVLQVSKQNISNKSPSHQQNGNAYWRTASRRSSSYSWELKAIQKEAVLSFYRRQTGVASKDIIERKTPRSSSFSHFRDSSVMDKSVPLPANSLSQSQWKRSLSNSSFSQVSQSHPCSANSSARNASNGDSQTKHSNVTASIKSFESSMKGRKPDPVAPPVELEKATTPNSTETSESDSNALHEVPNFIRDTEPDSDNSQSYRSVNVPITACKAYLKKASKTKENVVMKVLSSQGITLAKGKDEINICSSYTIKPKVPPKRLPKHGFVMPHKHQASSPPLLLQQEGALDPEDQEIQAIESAARSGVLCDTASGIMASSPDLPLPPPPASYETEVFPTDDPFPPPPDFKEFSFTSSEAHQTLHSFDHNRNCKPSPDDLKDSSCEMSQTCANVSNIGAQCTEVFLENTSPEWTDEILQSKNSSPTVYSKPYIPCDDQQTSQRVEVENEAVYVNLDFRNRDYKKVTTESLPESSMVQPVISVTNSATQTSEATPSLHRKTNKLLKINDLSESSQNYAIFSTKHITVQDHKTNHLENSALQSMTLTDDNYSVQACYSSCPGNETLIPSNVIGLPSTNPYFTTSEPKAKLLTRYCHSWDKQWPDQLELKGQKEELIASISTKLNVLRLEQIELKEEMKQNEELGQEVTAKIEKIAKPNEVQKYRIHVEELEKIINLLLSLSGRLARAENALLILPEDAKEEEKSILEAKRNKLTQQHDEAWHLKENIDRRSSQVSLFLHHYLSKEEYADYEHFIKMKSKLLMDAREIDEKIRLGEEQLAALRGTFQATQQNGEIDIKLNGELTELVKK